MKAMRARLEKFASSDEMRCLYDRIIYKENSVEDSILKKGILKVLQEEYWPLLVYVTSKGNKKYEGRLSAYSLPEPDAEVKDPDGHIENVQIVNIGEGHQRALNREYSARNKIAYSSATYRKENGEVKEVSNSRMIGIDIEGDVRKWLAAIEGKLSKPEYNITTTLLVNIRVEAQGFIDDYESEFRRCLSNLSYNNSISAVHISEGGRIWISTQRNLAQSGRREPTQ